MVELVRQLGAFANQVETQGSPAPETASPQTLAVAVPTTQYSLIIRVFFVPFREKGDQVIGREKALAQVRGATNQRPPHGDWAGRFIQWFATG
ncbi:MAG: hypothetical protein U0X75_03600 [Acidobacteriota bacterium]